MQEPARAAAPSDSVEGERGTLRASYAAGLLSMGQSELLTLIVPLWAVMLDVSPKQIGILVASGSVLTFILAIHGGALIDRFGARRVMMACAIATGAIALLYPFIPWFWAMIGIQMLIGFAGNMTWIGAQTVIGQASHGDPTKIGRFSFFARIGSIMTPFPLGIIWDMAGPHVAFMTIAAWSLALFAVASRIYENNPTPRTSSFSWRQLLPRLSDYTGSIRMVLAPVVAFTLAISFMRHTTNGVENSFFVVYLKELGFAATAIGLLFSVSEMVNGCGSLMSGRLARYVSVPWLMVGFTALAAVLIMITPFLGGIYLLLMLTQSMRRASEGIVQPLMFSLQTRAVSRDRQGAIVGLRVTNNRLASIVTPALMGFTVELAGVENAFVLAGCVLLIAAAVLSYVIVRTPALRQA